jgi:hypothetical protein
MNMVIDIKTFNPTAISFLDLKKNNIIDGNFSKIIYGDSNITFNGVYLCFHIIPHHVITYNESNYSVYYLDSNQFNTNVIAELSAVESAIIDYYKELYKINKTSVYQLKTQLQSGNVKIYKREQYVFSGGGGDEIPMSSAPLTQRVTHHYYTNAFSGMAERNDMRHRKEMKNYLLKISGIWENKFNVGITYKMTELQQQIL